MIKKPELGPVKFKFRCRGNVGSFVTRWSKRQKVFWPQEGKSRTMDKKRVQNKRGQEKASQV